MRVETELLSSIISVIRNPIRRSIIRALSREINPLRFSRLMEACGLDPNSDTGQFHYHLTKLVDKNLVRKDGQGYILSVFGFKVSKILEVLAKECFLAFGRMKGGEGSLQPKSLPEGIRPYCDEDFKTLAKMLMKMYNEGWEEMFGPEASKMTSDEAKMAVTTDMLVPDTRVLVAEHGPEKKLVGFISYAIRYGGAYFIEYHWVDKEYSQLGYGDKLLRAVEEEARMAGENQINLRISHREHSALEYYIQQGYETLNFLELAKYLEHLPTPYSGEEIQILGHKLKLR